MLLKSPDSHTEEIVELERVVATLSGQQRERAQKELRQLQAGLKNERDVAYFLDFSFGKSLNSVLIHDLRLEHDGRVAQIDHLLCTRTMDWYVLESKHFHAGVKITEEGEFLRWNDFKKTYEGMKSPLRQNERHIAVLRGVLGTLDLPTRLGIRILPTLKSYVLISAKSRVDRPRKFDTSHVLKADEFPAFYNKEVDHGSTMSAIVGVAKAVARDTLQKLAAQLVALHRPIKYPLPPWLCVPADRAPQAPATAAPADPPGHQEPAPAAARPAVPASIRAGASTRRAEAPESLACEQCHGKRGELVLGKFGPYLRCADCHANTAIRLVCEEGHHPKLRKSGEDWYRDCPECRTSDLYFAPAKAAPPAPPQFGPCCKKCKANRGRIEHGKYGYFFRCADCGTNTAIHFECKPGHTAKLRKAGENVYRDCAECGSSLLYFVNAQA